LQKDDLKNAKGKLLIKRVGDKFEGNHNQELIRLNQEEFDRRIRYVLESFEYTSLIREREREKKNNYLLKATSKSVSKLRR